MLNRTRFLQNRNAGQDRGSGKEGSEYGRVGRTQVPVYAEVSWWSSGEGQP